MQTPLKWHMMGLGAASYQVHYGARGWGRNNRLVFRVGCRAHLQSDIKWRKEASCDHSEIRAGRRIDCPPAGVLMSSCVASSRAPTVEQGSVCSQQQAQPSMARAAHAQSPTHRPYIRAST